MSRKTKIENAVEKEKIFKGRSRDAEQWKNRRLGERSRVFSGMALILAVRRVAAKKKNVDTRKRCRGKNRCVAKHRTLVFPWTRGPWNWEDSWERLSGVLGG